VKEDRIKDFLAIVRFDEEINFDYKVRDLTHRFLIDFLESLSKEPKLEDLIHIKDQIWFLSDYATDITVMAMIDALHTISEKFNDNFLYFDYILTAVRFWHFKTEATSQGEELYITMNSRGEKLASNEEQKAQILPKGDLPKWGQKWEEWQDFFWKNRKRGIEKGNDNADNGFNGFLSCIAGLEYYIKDKNSEKDISKLLTPGKIDNHYKSFKYLIDRKDTFQGNYSYSDWVDKCLSEIWTIFNENKTDWFADYKDKNKSTERNKMIFIWSWLYYLSEVKSEEREIDIAELFRLLRFFYVRYNNFNRSVTTLKKTIDMILKKDVWDTMDSEIGDETAEIEEETDRNFRTKEETAKNKLFSNFADTNNIFALEEIIWKIEDHPLNINGRDLGNENISHLVDFSVNQSIDDLQKIYDKFVELFPTEKCNGKYEKTLKSLLLHHKDENGNLFWNRVSPWYYENYNCSDWRRIIRGSIFRKVFTEIFDTDNKCTIDTVLRKRKEEFYSENNSIAEIRNGNLSKWKQLIIYSDLVDIWECGNIAFYGNLSENETRIFNNEQRIYKLYNSFKGHSKELWEEVKEKDIEKELQEILNKLCPNSNPPSAIS
jgi:hypothetical protein